MSDLRDSHYPTRRTFLRSSAAAACALSVAGRWEPAFAASPILTVDTRIIEVNGKPAKVFSVVGRDGRPGLFARAGDRLDGCFHAFVIKHSLERDDEADDQP